MKKEKFVDETFVGLDGYEYDGQMKYILYDAEKLWMPVCFYPEKRRVNEPGCFGEPEEGQEYCLGEWEEYSEPFDPGDLASPISAK